MIALRLGWRNLWRNSRTKLDYYFCCGLRLCLSDCPHWIDRRHGRADAQEMGRACLWATCSFTIRPIYPSAASTIPSAVIRAASWKGFSTNSAFILSWWAALPECYGFGLLSTGENSAGVRLMGVDPQVESTVSSFLSELQAGALGRTRWSALCSWEMSWPGNWRQASDHRWPS